MSDVETIKSKQPSVDVYTYNAGHGFQCDERDSFAPEAAQIAWGPHPCASLTAICKMDVLLLAKNAPHPLWRTFAVTIRFGLKL